jgi:hypothetical protein
MGYKNTSMPKSMREIKRKDAMPKKHEPKK